MRSAARICRICATPSIQHLIAADNLLDEAEGRGLAEGDRPWVEAHLRRLQPRRPAGSSAGQQSADRAGGAGRKAAQLYELDVRSICHNLLATLTRREEAYHHKVRAGESAADGDVASIHDRVVFKQQASTSGCNTTATRARASSTISIRSTRRSRRSRPATYDEVGDFVTGPYEAKLRRDPDRMQVQLIREGHAGERTMRITKGVTLEAGDDTLEIAYLLEGLPPGETLHFGVEFNFAGMPSGADDRYFRDGDGNVLGQLGTMLDLTDVDALGLTDEWLGIDVDLKIDRPTLLLDIPDRDGEPIGSRLRVGAPIGRRACRTGSSRPTPKAAGA